MFEQAHNTRRWTPRMTMIAWSVSGMTLLCSIGGLGYVTATELDYLSRAHLPTPPEVTRDVVVSKVTDKIGRKASFRILLFTDEFRWRLSSFDSLDATPDRPLFTAEMKAVLNSAEEIIAVGASSEELPAGISAADGRVMEERRAGRRAEQIAMWIREALSKPVPVRKLNVGYHAPTRSLRPAAAATRRQGRGALDDTSEQRRVVIILVLEHEEDVNMDQALRAAMATESVRAPIFEALLTRYSLSAGQAFTWVP